MAFLSTRADPQLLPGSIKLVHEGPEVYGNLWAKTKAALRCVSPFLQTAGCVAAAPLACAKLLMAVVHVLRACMGAHLRHATRQRWRVQCR